ncbi:hypothetical protein [Thermococcus thioreducens]|uniref:Uncharacterized protein n=1 Tax=Thermococcus thioreducens TaxID=277988 RepID=A0A0Q2QQG3_9EURY|nr:hypothetical protein [Thermococcus thioreducens]ASJ12928.1 hypothetical protein A3L14_08535 [Thermococcus thioreducens]KQH82197.1 hypothetical protein AMR53_07090 [Thermococcus thioreducens]SEV83321.1 hypothetical protein SAMN05216170_0237 [Thermococcus thioreducens]
MKLVRDLSALFALLVSLSLLMYAQPEHRRDVGFYLGISFVVLAFLLLAIWRELERLEDRILELEFILGESDGGENDGEDMEK